MKHWILAALALAVSCSQQPNVVKVKGGLLEGVPSAKEGVTVFKGVRYAEAPVGDLRWKAPKPVEPWEGVLRCDHFGPISLQSGNAPGSFYGDEFYWEGTPDMDEDCLSLNIWAPTKSLGRSAGLPVALWIHGGAFQNGYGYEVTMDGDEWAARGVILVTINYRLGTLGFLSHPELTAEQGQSGNYGLMDQIAALKWVRSNIKAFGGDPANITVFGQSAGAMSVKNLLISPASRDLIAKAIIQSGGGVGTKGLAPARGVSQESHDALGKAIMDNAGLETLEKMRAASAREVFEAAGKFMAARKGFVMLSPHNDGKYLTETFDEALFDGNMAKVPILIGYNKDDMGMLAGASVDRFCELRDSLGFPVYEYEFLRELPTDEAHPASAAGAFHSAELWYMFGTTGRSWRPFTNADRLLSAQMVDAWTDFCKTGTPGWAPYPHKELLDTMLPREEASPALSQAFDAYLKAVEENREDLHSIMVLQGGKVVLEKMFAPDTAHILHSVSKTFTATAVGFAIEEGLLKLDSKIVDLFPESVPETPQPYLDKITVRHLLTMNAGHAKDPTAAIRGEEGDWVRGFMEWPIEYEPGTCYCYSSLGTYLLSAAVQKVTGQKVVDYLETRLWQPLGIARPSWLESPAGVNTGGWGLYLHTEDMARMGQCLLDGGRFNGRQVIPARWVAEMSKYQVPSVNAGINEHKMKELLAENPSAEYFSPEKSDWVQGYGYQMWRCRHNAFRADGAYGQYIIVIPEKNAVVVTTAQIGNMQEEIDLIWDHLLPAL